MPVHYPAIFFKERGARVDIDLRLKLAELAENDLGLLSA
jgi:hypothetical protein